MSDLFTTSDGRTLPTLPVLQAVTQKVNTKRDRIFREQGWPHPNRLTEGDVMIVIEVWLEREAALKQEQEQQT